MSGLGLEEKEGRGEDGRRKADGGKRKEEERRRGGEMKWNGIDNEVVLGLMVEGEFFR